MSQDYLVSYVTKFGNSWSGPPTLLLKDAMFLAIMYISQLGATQATVYKSDQTASNIVCQLEADHDTGQIVVI